MRKLVQKKGFGLLEALIASGIIIMIATASIGLANVISKNTINFSDVLIADSLASEALDIASLMRDQFKNDGDSTKPWSYGYTNNRTGASISCLSSGEGICKIDPARSNFDSNTNFYFDDDGSETIDIGSGDNLKQFTREIKIDPVADIEGYQFKVTVKKIGETNALSEVSTILTNWK